MIISITQAIMQTPVTWFIVCLLLLVTQSVSGYTIDEHSAEDYGADQKDSKLRDIKPESVLMGIAKTLIGGKTGAASGQVYIEQYNFFFFALLLYNTYYYTYTEKRD